MAASLFAEPRLLAAHRAALRARGAGPQHVSSALSGYLAAEQKRGAIRADTDPRAAAALLIGACLQHAFLSHFADQPDDAQFATTLVRILTNGLRLDVTSKPNP